MARLCCFVFVIVVLSAVCAMPGRRLRRGYNIGYGSGGGGGGGGDYSGYRGSDERDASVSDDNGCATGYSRGYSGSRELSYNRDGRQTSDTRGGRSFAKSTASAAASSMSFSQNQRANIV